MIKKYLFVLVFYVSTLFMLTADDKPVIIALAPFMDFSRFVSENASKYEHLATISLRDKVAANLLQNYNCVILSRSNGLTLSSEHKLNILNQLDAENNTPLSLLNADYAIVGYFRVARRIPGKTWKVNLNCTLRVADFHKNNKIRLKGADFKNAIFNVGTYKNITFIPDKSTLYADDVTKEIVKALNLKPRTREYEKQKGKIDETWAVLPIKRFDSKEALRKAADRNLAIDLELSLQESGKLKRIVDHNEIDKVLRELKISSLNNATESAVGSIAQLIGADKIIMGSVSKLNPNGKKLRLDLFLVDGKRAIILDSETAIALPPQLSSVVSNMVLKFTCRTQTLPEFPDSNSKRLEKEGVFYWNILYAVANNVVDQTIRCKNTRAYAELIYLLANNDDRLRYEAVRGLVQSVTRNPVKDKKDVGDFIKILLKNIQPLRRTFYYLYLADMWTNDTADIDEKIDIAKQYLKQFPERFPEFQHHVIGTYYFEKKDFKKALEYAKQAEDPFFGKTLLPDVYRELGGVENNRKELALRKVMRTDIPRLTELMRKFEEPDEVLRYLSTKSFCHAIANPLAKVLTPQHRLELARVYLGVGEKAMADMILENFYDAKYANFQEPEKNVGLRSEYESIIKEIGKEKGTWRSLADILGNSSPYKIYIQPLGNADLFLIKRAAILAEEFLGLKIKILPYIPLPYDSVCFSDTKARYNAYFCVHRIHKARKIPPDAMAVINIMGKELSFGVKSESRLSYMVSGNIAGEGIITYQAFYACLKDDYSLQNGFVEMLAKAIATRICRFMRLRRMSYPLCIVPTCIASGEYAPNQLEGKKFAFCEKCQEVLKKSSHDLLFTTFRRFFDRQWPISRHDRKYHQKQYEAILKKTLAEGKKIADENAKNPVKLLPAITPVAEPLKGLRFAYYEFEPNTCKSTEDLKKLTPIEKGIIETFNQSKNKRKKNCGVIFEGLIKIPFDGKYRFYSSSYAGSRLWLGDKELINNDGIQAVWEKPAEIALKAGYHPIKLSFIQGDLEELLAVYYRGPKTLGQQIPADVLFHKE